MTITLDEYQFKAIQSVKDTFKHHKRCLLKMFCGTGKTRIMFHFVLETHNKIILVFPSLLLIDQFNLDYTLGKDWIDRTKKYSKMNVCSKDESANEKKHNVKTTTDHKEVKKFLTKNNKYILCVTYQSLNVLNDVMTELKHCCDIIVCDEAHHLVGDKAQEYIFGIKCIDDDDFEDDIDIDDKNYDSLSDCAKYMLFLTATPNNKNGIKMFDSNDQNAETHCGPCAFNYSHKDAVEDNVCRDFRIEIDLFTDNTDENLFKSIGRSIGNSGNNRVLTFHSYSEKSHINKSDVVSFIKKKNDIVNDIQKTLDEEFNNHGYTRITVDGITGKDSMTKRKNILKKFNTPSEHTI